MAVPPPGFYESQVTWAVYICNYNNIFINVHFHDFNVKNYFNNSVQNKTNERQKVVSPVFNRVAKWAIFVALGRVWRTRRHSSIQSYFERPPGQLLVPTHFLSTLFFRVLASLHYCTCSTLKRPWEKRYLFCWSGEGWGLTCSTMHGW